MARRQVLVQLDDDLVDRLDELAAARGTNRSALLREGAIAVLSADAEAEADRRLLASYRRVPQDPGLVEAARHLAGQTGPTW